MTALHIGLLYGGATLVALFSGIPIAFALGGVAVLFMAFFMPGASLDTVTQNVYEEMASITSHHPLFILKGAAIGKSRAGQDLYAALHAWLHRIPGGLASPSCSPAASSRRWPRFGRRLLGDAAAGDRRAVAGRARHRREEPQASTTATPSPPGMRCSQACSAA